MAQPQGTGRCFGGPQPRAAARAAALGGPPPSRRDRPRILTSQAAAAASIARMPLPPLQDEVGVGPLGDPQRVGQQHLLWVHPHIPGRRGRTHNGAAGRLLHTPARTGAHSRTRSPARPRPGGKRLQQRAARGAPATTKPPRAAGEDGEDAGTVSSILPARRRRRLPRARGRRRPGLPPAARPRPRAAGGGGSGVAKSRDPARRWARLRATRAASAPRGGPSRTGVRLLPRRRPKLRAASVSSRSEP